MLSAGGFMKHFIGAVAAAKAAEVASRTDTVKRIINHATDSAEQVADFLEKLLESLEENTDDLSV